MRKKEKSVFFLSQTGMCQSRKKKNKNMLKYLIYYMNQHIVVQVNAEQKREQIKAEEKRNIRRESRQKMQEVMRRPNTLVVGSIFHLTGHRPLVLYYGMTNTSATSPAMERNGTEL